MRKTPKTIPLSLRLIFSVVCGAFILLGLALAFFGIRGLAQERAIRAWRVVDCRIVSSAIVEHKSANGKRFTYPFKISFTYEADGKTRMGDRFRLGYVAASDYADSADLPASYPAGATTTCLVDPTDPSNAYLTAPPEHSLFSTLVALFFLAISILFPGAILLAIWRSPQREEKPAHGPRYRLKKIGVIYGLCLFLGLVLFVLFTLPALIRGHEAQGWTEVPCRIDHSGVQSNRQGRRRGGPTYSVAVLFEYTYEGRAYKSSRYDIAGISSSDYPAHQAIADALPPGKQTVCYVNPRNPQDAVLDRTYFSSVLPFLLGSLLLIVLGVGGWVDLLRKPAPAS